MLKNYVTISSDRSVILRNAGWDMRLLRPDNLISMYRFTYCWDFAKITNAWWLMRHELILIRTLKDNNYLTGESSGESPATEPTLELFKVQWRMPHVLLSEINKCWCYALWRADEHGFSLVGSVRVSALAEHKQAFVGHQDDYSARETTLRHFRYANTLKKHHVQRYKLIRWLKIIESTNKFPPFAKNH